MFEIRRLQKSAEKIFSPDLGASQVGSREIRGEIPSTRERISLLAWAIVFPTDTEAQARYDLIAQSLVDLDANASVREPIDGIQGETFGNMSERTDLLGDMTTIWVTSRLGSHDEHGALLASTGGILVQLISTDLYQASGRDRAIYLLETLARRMAARERDLKLSAKADTMARLPILVDVHGLLENPTIDFNRYSARGNR